MAPNFANGQIIEIKLFKNESNPQHNQVVSVKFSTNNYPMLKRIYAVPGDRIEFKDGQLILNNKNTKPFAWDDDYQLEEKNYFILKKQLQLNNSVLKNNQFIVFGDNQTNSLDSFDYGIIERKQITGFVINK